MPRSARQDTSAAGQDSFLDIVANIVGILIIRVMVVGVRAKNAPVTAAIPGPATQAARAELHEDMAAEQSLHRDVLDVVGQIESVRREAVLRHAKRAQLATAVSAWERRITSRRDRLDAKAREEFDLRRQAAESRSNLDRLRHEQARAERAESTPIRIESYPTPLSKTVHGPEVHLQLRSQRVTVVPWEPLIERFEADARRQVHKLQSREELTSKVGPIDGFRLRYTLERRGDIARLRNLRIIPVISRLGETIEQALAPDSLLRETLSQCRPSRTTVTVWTYPDSFAEFRRLKKELYHLGFMVAARPLPHDTPIGASPEGSRSAAQ